MKRITSCSLTIILLFVPLLGLSQEPKEPCARAEADVSDDVDFRMWYALGLFLGPLGVAAGYFVPPTPLEVNLVGKTPEYVANYTECYKKSGRMFQLKNSAFGCATTTCLISSAYIAFLIIFTPFAW